jgi:hypothetical protein
MVNHSGLQKKGWEKYAKYKGYPPGALMAFIAGNGVGAISIPADQTSRDAAIIALKDKA